jgi:hypothetical protein
MEVDGRLLGLECQARAKQATTPARIFGRKPCRLSLLFSDPKTRRIVPDFAILICRGTVNTVSGIFPFGAKLQRLAQRERSPKRIFVLGVYASAVHAQWVGPVGRILVRALVVASEPVIFWDGAGADQLVAAITVPAGAGHLVAAEPELNGPSGRSIDSNYLRPLGASRRDAWLCDLVPYSCLNPRQAAAIQRAYEPRRVELGLPEVILPSVPKAFADDERRHEILGEIEEANADVIVLLGDQPVKEFLASFDPRWTKLSDFGITAETYGRLHDVTFRGRRFAVLPLVHPRQASGLGSHSASWRELHSIWKRTRASRLLT